MNFVFDYSKLRGKIREVFGTEAIFAEKLQMSKGTLSFKLNGKAEWTNQEMVKATKLLGEPIAEINTLFFTERLGKTN